MSVKLKDIEINENSRVLWLFLGILIGIAIMTI
jgi:hypothetical protein